MPQHFLLSPAAKTLSLASVFRMSDAEAEALFRKVRWPETDGASVCPKCGGLDAYEFRRPTGALRFECKACCTGHCKARDARERPGLGEAQEAAPSGMRSACPTVSRSRSARNGRVRKAAILPEAASSGRSAR